MTYIFPVHQGSSWDTLAAFYSAYISRVSLGSWILDTGKYFANITSTARKCLTSTTCWQSIVFYLPPIIMFIIHSRWWGMAWSMMTFTTLLLNILRLSFVVPRRPVPAYDPQILCGEFETVCTVGLCDIPGCDQCTLDVADCTTGNVSEPIPQTLHHTIKWLALRYHGLPVSLDGSMFAKFTRLSVLKLYANFSSL